MWYYGLLFFGILVVDQATKWWAVQAATSEWVLTDMLSLVLTYNRGVAWSLFSSEHTVAFVVLSLVIAAVMLCFSYYSYQLFREGHSLVGPVCILSGAVGNLIDRCFYGGVVDFIMVHYHDWVWPLFNIADIAICIGAFLFIIAEVKHPA